MPFLDCLFVGINCADIVRDLSVLLDSEMSMQRHIGNVTGVCFYHLRRLRQIRNYVSQSWHSLWYHLSSLASIIATASSPAFLHIHWHRCNEYKMWRLDWCLILIGGRTSVLHYNNCIDCQWSIVTPSRSPHSCTNSTQPLSIVPWRLTSLQRVRPTATSA